MIDYVLIISSMNGSDACKILKDLFPEIMDTKKNKKRARERDNMPGRSTCVLVLGNKT